jgi:hypothetical protein
MGASDPSPMTRCRSDGFGGFGQLLTVSHIHPLAGDGLLEGTHPEQNFRLIEHEM